MISERERNEGASTTVLLPIMAAIVGLYLVIGLAMPVLPLYVHQRLGFGPFMVGAVSGSQFAAAMMSRLWAGQHVDSRGAKNALVSGLLISVVAGLIYVLSFYSVNKPASVGVLLLGRSVLERASLLPEP